MLRRWGCWEVIGEHAALSLNYPAIFRSIIYLGLQKRRENCYDWTCEGMKRISVVLAFILIFANMLWL